MHVEVARHRARRSRPGTAGTRSSDAVDETGRSPRSSSRRARQTARSCHAACSHACAARPGPGRIGRTGCVRSKAWICAFSSTQNTTACVGRVQVQTDNIAHLLDQQRVRRQLECLGAMRLQPERAPDLLDRSCGRGPSPAPCPGLLQCVAPRGVSSSVRTITLLDLPRRSRDGRAGRGSSYNPSTPFRTKRLRHLQTVVCDMRSRFAHYLVIVPLGARQNDPRPPRQMRRRPRAMGQRVKSHALVVRQNQRYLWASRRKLASL